MGDNLLRYPELGQAVIGHSRKEQGQDDVRTSKHDGKQACLCRADPRQVGLDYGLSWKWFGRPNHSIVARPLCLLSESSRLMSMRKWEGTNLRTVSSNTQLGLSVLKSLSLMFPLSMRGPIQILFTDKSSAQRFNDFSALISNTRLVDLRSKEFILDYVSHHAMLSPILSSACCLAILSVSSRVYFLF
ncbi:hypothetical protein TIFTF001_050578 [Ficus carica]|uniref:Uncharacterized protein n=1 Tax=Ficus carica TaxID=3494 RepID=A0AA87Z5B9_FICCA|nr:hypothetical protein TIFTF001_050578 [Ficus carica]